MTGIVQAQEVVPHGYVGSLRNEGVERWSALDSLLAQYPKVVSVIRVDIVSPTPRHY
jgi:hypothetical protein